MKAPYKKTLAVLLALLFTGAFSACNGLRGSERTDFSESFGYESGDKSENGSADGGKNDGASDSEIPGDKIEEINYLKDPFFKNGFWVCKTKEGAADFHEQPFTTAFADVSPDWQLAQWASKYDIFEGEQFSAFGEYVFTYNATNPSAKKVGVNTRTGKITLELNAETEYERDRREGEQWPHLLIGQEWSGEELVRLADMRSVVLRMDYTITKLENKSYSEPDPNLHCAQFVWYVTLQNRNVDSPDFGRYIWFGLNLFDNRTEGSANAGFAAQDGGKEQNTGAFIYQPASSVWSENGALPAAGQLKEVFFDLTEEAAIAYEIAVGRGFLGSTRFEDLYIGSTNLGFEVTGTYNIGVEIGNLGIICQKRAETSAPQNKR